MTTAKPKLMTADDLMRLDAQGIRGELIRGVFHEATSVGKLHAKVVAELVFPLMGFVLPRRLGTALAADLGVRLERDPETARAPDAAYVSAARLPLDDDDPGFSEVVPDLAVEVRSPNDSRRELRAKALTWLDYGASLVWVAHPSSRTVDVYRADGPTATLTESDTLYADGVLPGFVCQVSEVFTN